MKEIDKVLDIHERVLWEGRPKFWPYFLSLTVPTFFVGLLITAILVPFVGINFLSMGGAYEVKSLPPGEFLLIWNLMLIPFGLASLWLLIGSHIYRWALYRYLYYTITDKRVIFQKGFIGRDFEYIDFDQVTNASVRVDFWDKVVGKNSGSILISSAGSSDETYYAGSVEEAMPYTIRNIENPYEVFKLFKKVSHDVRTDIQYPNKIRPSKNPGYQSNYDPDKD